MSDREELLSLASQLRRDLQDRRSLRGGVWKERAPAPSAGPAAPAAADVPPPPAAASPATDDFPYAGLPPEEALRKLREEEIGDCRRCPLAPSRQKLVFGVGNPRALVMFVGEGPGFMEDRQGEPFVGPAGQLLDKMLAAIGLTRQPADPSWKSAYIANMVKCHPMTDPSQPDKRGNDRPPSPAEMAACRPFLMKQIRIIRPRFLVALGAVAAKALLNTSRGLTSFRGQWFDFSPEGDDALSLRLLPTYHPSALLRTPDLKKDAWEDLKKLHAEMLKVVS